METRSGMRKDKTKPTRRMWVCALAGGLFAGFAGQWGWQLERAQNVDLAAWQTWAVPLTAALVLTLLLAWGFCGLEKWCCRASRSGGSKERTAVQNRRKMSALWTGGKYGLPLLAALLFVCWLPVFLAVYPGFFAYDATDELQQVLTGNYVTRHPLLHVLVLGKTVSGVGELTGSYNTGIAVYVLCQMAVMAFLLAWEIRSLQRLGAGSVFCGISFCFFAFFPVIVLYVLCTSKDIWYTAGMLAAVTLLCRYARGQSFTRAGWAGLFFALFATAVFRNNGFYVFLVWIPVLLVLAKKADRKKMAAVTGTVLLSVFVHNALLGNLLKPGDTGAQETLTVPIQQLARTWKYSPEVFSQEEREALFEILPQEVLERYTPKLSDLVKIDFRSDVYRKNPGRYRRLWLQTGCKAPATYLNAWLMTSYGFWYPDASIDVYNGWRNYVKSSWFSFETEEPGVRKSRLPWLEEQYRKLSLDNIVQQMPVVSWLFSPGAMCWVFVLGGLFCLSTRRCKVLGALLPIYVNWLTVLLGPTYLVRYVLIFWFALPLLMAAVFAPWRYRGDDEIGKLM